MDILKTTGGYHTTITGLASAKVADALTDSSVDSFTVEDAGADLGANFADLVSAYESGKLTGVTNSDVATVPIAFADLLANPTGYARTLDLFAAKPTISLS